MNSGTDIIDSRLTEPDIRHHHGQISHAHPDGYKRHDHGFNSEISGWNPSISGLILPLVRFLSLSAFAFSVMMFLITWGYSDQCSGANVQIRDGYTCHAVIAWHASVFYVGIISLILAIVSRITAKRAR